jgi:hypothetical protein
MRSIIISSKYQNFKMYRGRNTFSHWLWVRNRKFRSYNFVNLLQKGEGSPSPLNLSMLLVCFRRFYATESNNRGHVVFVLSISLSSAKNFNLGYKFWTASTMALIFYIEYSLWQDLSMGTNYFDFVTLILMFDLLIENCTMIYVRALWYNI